MGHSSVRIKVRRRKVANLAAKSKQFSVRNCTIHSEKDVFVNWEDNKLYERTYKITKDKDGKELKEEVLTLYTPDYGWKNPKEGYPQHKPMMKKHCEWIYDKEAKITRKVHVPSTFPTKKYDDIQKTLWKNLGKAAKMEAYTQEKLKKWEKKHPKPCPDDDLFKDEMIPAWEAEKEKALIRIRDFVVSMFDKLPLIGRFEQNSGNSATYQEKMVAELKDINGDGHRVNELDKKSKLLSKAQKVTNEVKAKNASLVATNLKDHKRKKGRMILPQAA